MIEIFQEFICEQDWNYCCILFQNVEVATKLQFLFCDFCIFRKANGTKNY